MSAQAEADLAVHYRLLHRDSVLDSGVFAAGDRLAVSVELPLTGRQRLLDVGAEVRAFLLAGAANQRYAVEAVEVFEKFGEAIEERTVFTLLLSNQAFS